MSECSICGEYSDCLHPVDFKWAEGFPRELEEFLGIGGYVDDLDASDAADEFWEECAHLCHECMGKYGKWIVWFG